MRPTTCDIGYSPHFVLIVWDKDTVTRLEKKTQVPKPDSLDIPGSQELPMGSNVLIIEIYEAT